MSSPISVFRNHIKKKGMRWTGEREIILETIFAQQRHFDVDSLHFELKKKDKKISRASVYRTMPLLVQCGLVKEVHQGGEQKHYEPVYGVNHHDHLLCNRCGRIIEFLNDDLESLQEKICAEFGFEAATHSLVIKGTCGVCQGKDGE